MKRTLPTLSVAALLSSIDIRCQEWDEERLRAFCDRYRRRNWNAIHVLTLTEVSPENRFWLACHQYLCPSAVVRRFAVDAAAEALLSAKVTDKRSWAALDAALAYERGEIDKETLSEACAAACDATRYAAWGAAKHTARSAACDAAWDAARYTACGAARYETRAEHCDRLTALLLRWVDGQDVLAGSVERAEVSS